jgi:hypothetical protein
MIPCSNSVRFPLDLLYDVGFRLLSIWPNNDVLADTGTKERFSELVTVANKPLLKVRQIFGDLNAFRLVWHANTVDRHRITGLNDTFFLFEIK